jgi:hypothetical protein
MNPEPKCPKCGRPAPANLVEGLCPRCLAQVSLGSAEAIDAAPSEGVPQPSAPEVQTKPSLESSIYEQVGDRSTRAISSFSSITLPEYVQRRIQENRLASLQEAVGLAPTNGLAFARPANMHIKPARIPI